MFVDPMCVRSNSLCTSRVAAGLAVHALRIAMCRLLWECGEVLGVSTVCVGRS
jgi:hypothetical protein